MVESAVSSAGVSTEDVAAVVSGRIITQQEVDDRLQTERMRRGLQKQADWDAYLQSAGMTEWDARAAIIKNLIDSQLVDIAAEHLGIAVSDEDIAASIEPLESRYPSHESFVEALEDNGYTEEEYTEAVGRSLLWQALVAQELSLPHPTEEQIRQYASVVAPTLAGKRSSHIVFSVNDWVLANQVLEELRQGADFAEMASAYSIDTAAPADGDQGWDSVNTFVDAYQTALDSLEPGELSDVIRTRFGYQIILCTDKYTAPLDAEGNIDIDAIPSDLMDVIVQYMSRNLATQLADNYIAYLEATTPIAVFDASGTQVALADVGLETTVTPATSSAEEAMERLQEEAEDGLVDEGRASGSDIPVIS